jgi:hypothetical protein
MMANLIGMPLRAARTTDSGEPPYADPGPDAVCAFGLGKHLCADERRASATRP